MRAEIISVGTELLLGDILNTNAQFLAQQLAALGYTVFYQTVVGDNAARLTDLIMQAKSRSDMLIFTGGLGPTDDDLTKQTVADVFGDSLVLDEEELARLEAFFKNRGVPMGDNNRKQAMVPRRGQKLLNPNGTAPGAFFRQGSKYAILLPGPPREMQPMFMEQALPLLEAMQDSSIKSVTLRVFGIGESALEEKVFDLLTGQNPTAALYAKTGEVHIRVTAKAATSEQADFMCHEYVMLFKRSLGELIYSDDGDDLETVGVKLLAARGESVATAESCTGGLLGERITSVPGASAVYGYGAITYANDAKRQMLGVRGGTLRRNGAVSGQVAAEMAFGAAKRADDDYGIGITGIAGPDGGSVQKPVGLVYIALAHGQDVFVKKLSVNSRGREYVRELAVLNALDMLRRAVLGLDIPGARTFKRNQEADFERPGKPRMRGGGFLRALAAVAAVAALLGLIMLGVQWAAQNRGNVAAAALPSAAGLSYGTPEYTEAACALVEQSREANPLVAGFVALPGARVEALVGLAENVEQAHLGEVLDGPDVMNMPVVASDASPARARTNTLLLGAGPFSPLLELADTASAADVSTFTYYTASDAKAYEVVAVFYDDNAPDDGTDEANGFDPAVYALRDYAGFLEFSLGTRARSLYDIPAEPGENDSYMTLAATDPERPGRRLYICGRLLPPGSELPPPAATPAADPLMPAAWYEENDRPEPAEAGYGYWLRWYLSRGVNNGELQLQMGLPAADSYPMQEQATQALPAIPEPEPPPPPESNAEAPVSSSHTPATVTDLPSSGEDLTSGMASSSSAPPVPSAPTIYIPPQPQPQKADPGTLTVTMNGEQVTAPAADILAMVCQAEAAGQEPAVVRAVAVAAHSWIMNQQGAGIAAPPVAGRKPSPMVRAAAAEVAGVVLSADGESPAFCPWFGMAARGTGSSEEVFGAYRAYLVPVSSPYEENTDGWRRYFTVTPEQLAEAALLRLGVDLTAQGEPDGWLTDEVRNDSGYVQTLKVGGVEVTGLYFWRQLLLNGETPVLPSHAFEVSWNGESFSFISYGSGHGCGLSLYGAAGYAREGWSFERILEHYYPGAKLLQLG